MLYSNERVKKYTCKHFLLGKFTFHLTHCATITKLQLFLSLTIQNRRTTLSIGSFKHFNLSQNSQSP